MKFRLFFLTCILSFSVFSQNLDLSDYSFVVVPDQFEFLSTPDQFDLNSMTKFYLNKGGFNAYAVNEITNMDRCDGLYANVEEVSSILGINLQLVLRDCHNNEIFRGPKGKTKYKEHRKAYQDALRKALNGIKNLRVQQKGPVDLNNKNVDASKEDPSLIVASGNLPTAKYSNYATNGKSFLLRKTEEGYSLYEESPKHEGGLILLGKITRNAQGVVFIDSQGKVEAASFDGAGNLYLGEGFSKTVYLLMP